MLSRLGLRSRFPRLKAMRTLPRFMAVENPSPSEEDEDSVEYITLAEAVAADDIDTYLPEKEPQPLDVYFFTTDLRRIKVSTVEGKTLMELAFDLDLIPRNECCGGIGGRTLENPYNRGPSCNACHMYISAEYLDKLPPITDEEYKALSRFGHRLTRTASRMTCQFDLTKDMDGMTAVIPPAPDITL